VFYLLASLARLKPEKGFYPALDIAGLYKILTTEQSLVLAHPGLAGQQEDVYGGSVAGSGKEERGGDRYQVNMRRKQKMREEEERRKQEEEVDKANKPMIDLTAEMKRLDEPRLKMVLEFFSDHFLKMAERSAKHRNHGQSYMYLRSAENLLSLLEELHYECRAAREQVMKLREGVNYSLYIKDYWAISHGHPGLGHSSSLLRQQSFMLPSLPNTPAPPADPEKKSVRIAVAAEVHDTDSESSAVPKVDLNFDFSESSDFGPEYTRM
jgi:hypothetical protein